MWANIFSVTAASIALEHLLWAVLIVEVLAAPELKGVKMTKKKTPKSGSPALFRVLFDASFEALEPNSSML